MMMIEFKDSSVQRRLSAHVASLSTVTVTQADLKEADLNPRLRFDPEAKEPSSLLTPSPSYL